MTSSDTSLEPKNETEIQLKKNVLNNLYTELRQEEEQARECYKNAYEQLREMGEHNRNVHGLMQTIATNLKEIESLICKKDE